MHRISQIVPGLVLAAATLTGCFFTQPINDRPRAAIKESTGPHYRGDQVRFTAVLGDSDDDIADLEWKARTCSPGRSRCDNPPFLQQSGLSRLFEVTLPAFRMEGTAETDNPTGSVAVELIVTDRGAATFDASSFVDVLNRGPTVELQIQGPRAPLSNFHPIGIPIQVVAVAQDAENDPVTFKGALLEPSGSAGVVVSETVDVARRTVIYEFQPDVAGTWQFEVATADSLDSGEKKQATIPVQPDAPPCMGSTDPSFAPDNQGARYILDRGSGPRRFAVLSAIDDLDVYPPPDSDDQHRGSSHFTWYISTPDTGDVIVEVQNHDVADYVIDPDAYTPGELLELRVEIEDRVTRAPCDPGEPFCALQGASCYQRVSWEIEVR